MATAEAFTAANCSIRIFESMTRNFWPFIASSESSGLFEVSDLRPFGHSAIATKPREENESSSARPNGPARSFCAAARSDGNRNGMSRIEIAGLKPPRNAAGITVPSLVPSCVPSIIWRALPSCDDGNNWNSTSPLVRLFTSSATLIRPWWRGCVGASRWPILAVYLALGWACATPVTPSARAQAAMTNLIIGLSCGGRRLYPIIETGVNVLLQWPPPMPARPKQLDLRDIGRRLRAYPL